MDFISNKAISIGVGVLITIIVTSAVIFTVTQVVSIYSKVYNTDTSIKGKYDEFDKFREGKREFTELEVYNTIKKYYGNQVNNKNTLEGLTPKDQRVKEITVTISFSELRSNVENRSSNMSRKWKASLETLDNGKVIINFEP